MPQVIRIEPFRVPQADLRVVSYVRVSSNSEKQEHSFAAQSRYYKQYIQSQKGWTFAGIYADEGITGTSRAKRKDFLRLLEDCRKRKIDLILTKSVARFGRNLIESIDSLRQIRAEGVHVVFEVEAIDTRTMKDELLFHLLSMYAEQQSRTISQNVRLGLLHRIEMGIFVPTSAPYGYSVQNRTLVPQEETAQVVRKIYDWYLEGYGAGRIVQMLEAERIQYGNTGLPWRYQQVLRILSNERYVGDVLYQKTYTTGFPFAVKPNRGEKDQYYLEGTHPALIDHEKFDRVQKLMQARAEACYNMPQQKWPFTRMLVCGHCGKYFGHHSYNGRITWVCGTHRKKASVCPMPGIEEQKLKRVFVRVYNKLKLYHYELLATPLLKMKNQSLQAVYEDPVLQQLNKAIQKNKEQCHTLSSMHQKGYVDTAHFIEKLNRLEVQRQELERTRREHMTGRVEIDYSRFEDLSELVRAGPDRLEEFHPVLFWQMVTHIDVLGSERIRIHMIGELAITEQLQGERI